MESTSSVAYLPFKTPLALLKSRFNITMNEDDYIEMAYPIYKSLGNAGASSKPVDLMVNSDGTLNLPDDCLYIKSLVLPFNDVDSRNEETDVKYSSRGPQISSNLDQGHKLTNKSYFQSGEHIDGHLLAYKFVDRLVIQITSDKVQEKKVTLVYGFHTLDEEGLPALLDKEIDAILYTAALYNAEKQIFMKVQGAAELAQYLRPLSERAIQAAKIPETLTELELDTMLEVKTSWDRKTYGKRYRYKY